MLLLILFYQVKDMMVHFYIIIIYVVNNSLIKYFYKFTLFEIIYFLIFIFLPGAYIFLKNQLIANFIFLCKLNLINIEQKKLREQCSHSRLISPVFLHMLGEYGKLLCKLPFLVQIQEKNQPQNRLRIRTLSTQWSDLVFHIVSLVFNNKNFFVQT